MRGLLRRAGSSTLSLGASQLHGLQPGIYGVLGSVRGLGKELQEKSDPDQDGHAGSKEVTADSRRRR